MKRIALAAYLLSSFSALAEEAQVEHGQKMTRFHCGRCHVVPGGNPFGSIGSTPSFRVLRNYPDWEKRFEDFYIEPPHRAVTIITGLSEPLDPSRPSPIAPMEMSEEDYLAILAFVATIEPKDVGTIE